MSACFLRTYADVMHDHVASWLSSCCGEGVLALIDGSAAMPFRSDGETSKVSA